MAHVRSMKLDRVPRSDVRAEIMIADGHSEDRASNPSRSFEPDVIPSKMAGAWQSPDWTGHVKPSSRDPLAPKSNQSCDRRFRHGIATRPIDFIYSYESTIMKTKFALNLLVLSFWTGLCSAEDRTLKQTQAAYYFKVDGVSF